MSAFERWLLHAATGLTAATGFLYFGMKYLLTPADPFSAVNHPWQPHVLALHVLAAPLLVFALGLIMREHIVGRFLEARPQQGRASGAATILVAFPMIVSGYLIQVVTDPIMRRVLMVIHVASGALFALWFGVHLLFAGTRRRAALGRRGERTQRRDRAASRRRLVWVRAGGILSLPRRRTGHVQTGPGGSGS
jgi:hypothetical protein